MGRGRVLRLAGAVSASAVALAITLGLVQGVLRSTPPGGDATSLLSLALVLGLAWLVVGILWLEAGSRARFEVRPDAFVPAVRPFGHVLRRKKWISVSEVVSSKLYERPEGVSLDIWLRDGTLIYVSESQGVDGERLRRLAGVLAAAPESG